MPSLFPTFSIPEVTIKETDDAKVFKPSPLFDFDAGDFVRDGANRVIYCEGRDGYVIWVLKMLKTQVGSCLSYLYAGIDMEGSLQEPTREAVQAAFERTITECIMAHPSTDRVYGFEFEWEPDALHINFLVKPFMWPSFDASMNIISA